MIVRDLISAVERERRERRRTESGRSKGIFAILAGGVSPRENCCEGDLVLKMQGGVRGI